MVELDPKKEVAAGKQGSGNGKPAKDEPADKGENTADKTPIGNPDGSIDDAKPKEPVGDNIGDGFGESDTGPVNIFG